MNEADNLRLERLDHKVESLEKRFDAKANDDKETNKNLSEVASGLNRMCDKLDIVVENQKEDSARSKKNEIELAQQRTTIQITQKLIAAIVIGSIIAVMGFKTIGG